MRDDKQRQDSKEDGLASPAAEKAKAPDEIDEIHDTPSSSWACCFPWSSSLDTGGKNVEVNQNSRQNTARVHPVQPESPPHRTNHNVVGSSDGDIDNIDSHIPTFGR